MRAQIRKQRRTARFADFARVRSDVRHQYDIIHVEKLRRHARLIRENIERRTCYRLRVECGHQRRVIDDAPARYVYQISVRAERCEYARVDELACVRTLSARHHETITGTR